MSLAIRQANETTLLMEYNHRLFNTMSTLLALVSRGRRAGGLSQAEDILAILDQRLDALSRAHRILSTPIPMEELAEKITELCLMLARGFGRDDVRPVVEVCVKDVPEGDIYVTLLILFELVVNALKHSLAEARGHMIWIELAQSDVDVRICVHDDGRPLTADVKPSRVVTALASLLDGEARVSLNGAWVAEVRFPCVRMKHPSPMSAVTTMCIAVAPA
jgi:two-component sensor histidine kinase